MLWHDELAVMQPDRGGRRAGRIGKKQKGEVQMIETEKIGQPILHVNDAAAAQLRKRQNKPKVTFLWKGEEQTLYVRVPQGISAEYVQGFRNAMFLHLLLSEQGWFTPRPQQPYTLCVIDRADVIQSNYGIEFTNCGEPLLIGVAVYDWIGGDVPKILDREQQAEAAIFLPDGDTKFVPLRIGGKQ